MSKNYRSEGIRDRGAKQGDGIGTLARIQPKKGGRTVRTALCVALCFVVFCAFFTGTGLASTIQVPDDQPTIQGAIDSSVNGDLVLVAPGTYFENIDFLGKLITEPVNAADPLPIVPVPTEAACGLLTVFNANKRWNKFDIALERLLERGVVDDTDD